MIAAHEKLHPCLSWFDYHVQAALCLQQSKCDVDAAQEAEVAPVVPQTTPRGGAKKGAEPIPEASSLALGPFSLQPATASLAVGAKQTISVGFNAQGAKLSLQQVGIDISDRCSCNATPCLNALSNVPYPVCLVMVPKQIVKHLQIYD